MRSFTLGYEVRTPIAELASHWPSARRERYLLKPDTTSPLSVDRAVWPAAKRQNPEHPLGFWSNYRAAISAEPLAGCDPTANAFVVRIDLVDDSCIQYFEPIMEGWQTDEPDSPPLQAEFLGYDVADHFLISGLTNCAPLAPGSDKLKQEWVGRLNAHGLFDDHSAATQFRDHCNRAIPEHAPFCIYHLVLCPPLT